MDIYMECNVIWLVYYKGISIWKLPYYYYYYHYHHQQEEEEETKNLENKSEKKNNCMDTS